VAKRKTLFDDRPVEISELTYIIRQDISALNAQIAQLQQYVRSQQAAVASGKGKAKAEGQVEEHNTNVVMMLQSRLASMGMGFKDVLELRTQNMKASKDRSEQFMHTASSSAQPSQGAFILHVSLPSLTLPSPGGGLLGSGTQAASASSASIPALPPTSSLLLQPHDRKGKRAATAPGTRAGTPDSMAGSGAKRSLGGADYLALDMNGDGGENGLGMGSVQAGSANQQAQMMEQQV
jgi:syntaxin 5